MRYIIITGVISILIIGATIGYWVENKEVVEADGEAVWIDKMEFDGIEIVNQIVDNNQLSLEIAIESNEDINIVITDKIHTYYDFFEQVFLNNAIDSIKVLILDKSNTIVQFTYSRQRYYQIDNDMGQEFFRKHIKSKGWDVLNNADNYWLSDESKEKLDKSIENRLINLD